MEGFYQIGWEKTEIDPVGSFFSVTDYVGPGAEQGSDRPARTEPRRHGTER